jgi:hypothetical protein
MINVKKHSLAARRRNAGGYTCDRCGAAIGRYDLDTAYRTKTETLCADCFREDVQSWLDNDPDTAAALLGYSVEKTEAEE